jgi:hypothetical protein
VVAVGERLAETRRRIGNRIRRRHAEAVEALGGSELVEEGAGAGGV